MTSAWVRGCVRSIGSALVCACLQTQPGCDAQRGADLADDGNGNEPVGLQDVVGTWAIRETVASTTCNDVQAQQATSETFTIANEDGKLVMRGEDVVFDGTLGGNTAMLREVGGRATLSLHFTPDSLTGRGELPRGSCLLRTSYAGNKTSSDVPPPSPPAKSTRPAAPAPRSDVREDAALPDFAGTWSVTEVVSDDCEAKLYERQYELAVVASPTPTVRIDRRSEQAVLQGGRLSWQSKYPYFSDTMETSVWIALTTEGTLTGKSDWKLLNNGDPKDACSGDATLTGITADRGQP